MSNAARIEYDIERAKELAAILDEERGIPDEARLANYYDASKYPQLATAMVIIIIYLVYLSRIYLWFCLKVLPTDFLDFAVAYLRRIHYILYFSGRQCRDESQVLITASGIQFRSVPTSTDENQDHTASLSRASRSHADDTDRPYDNDEDEDDVEEEDQEDQEGENPNGTVTTTDDKKEPAENEKSNQESSTTETKAPLKWIRKNSPLDKRIDDIMEASKKRNIRNKAPLDEKPPGSIDDEEADAIAAEAQKVIYSWDR